MSGLDRTEGTADDYEPRLRFDGVAAGGSCDITIKVGGSGLGVCEASGLIFPSHPDHAIVGQGTITMGSADNIDWFFGHIFADGFEAP